jgi:hypothetical protein
MKIVNLCFLLCLFALLTACPGSNYENAQKKLQKNNMDLPDPIKQYHNGIHYQLSNLFEEGYNKGFVIKDDATTKIIYELELNFSVEAFDKNEAKAFQFAFTDSVDLLNAVHDQYVIKRQNSLFHQFTSIKKPVDKSVGFTGITQTIQGETYENDRTSTYFMATVQVGDNYYVFQLIGLKENMGYLYDDFLAILNSIEK